MLEKLSHKDINAAMVVCSMVGHDNRVHTYHVDGLLIDTGPQSRAELLQDWFKTQPIEQVALTHNHEDHSGNARWIEDNLKVPIYLYEKAHEQAHEDGMYPKYRQIMWGHRRPFNPQPMPDKLETEKYTFEVFDTPGHTIYHNAFYEPSEGWLFTGDLYLSTRQYLFYIEENIRQTILTLEMLAELDFDTIFCAHAGVVENGKERLKNVLPFLKKNKNKCLKCVPKV